MSTFQNFEARGRKIPLIAAALTGDNGAPVNTVAATGVLTLTGNAVNDEDITLDTRVYIWKTALTGAADEILIGASASDSIDNLIAAITAGAGAGTLYGTGTLEHATVTAAAGAGDTMGVTAKTVGTGGNSIATTENMTNGSFGGGTLSGGVARETDAVEFPESRSAGQIRTYELTIVSSADDVISYDPYLWGDDSPTDLTVDQGIFSRLGSGSSPGHLNDGTVVGAGTTHVFRRVITHMGNSRFFYLEIDNLAGTNASIDDAYVREVVERSA